MANEDEYCLSTDNCEASQTEGMPTCPAPEDWKAELVWAHHRIFQPPEAHPESAAGLPDCGIGWLAILDTLCMRIESAIGPEKSGSSIKIVEIKERRGILRIYWEGTVSREAEAEIERAIELASAGSACTCESCGEKGQLYRCGAWLGTACSLHAKGEPVPVKPGLENVYILRGMNEGNVGAISCRLYHRETASFLSVDPDSIATGDRKDD